MRDNLDTLPTRQAMRPRTGQRRLEIRNGRRQDKSAYARRDGAQ